MLFVEGVTVRPLNMLFPVVVAIVVANTVLSAE